MPSGLDIYPYRPAAPETQPQGGLLQGLNEALDRVQGENKLRKELQIKGEYDKRAREDEMRKALMIERERTARELEVVEAKSREQERLHKMVMDVFSTPTKEYADYLAKQKGFVEKNVLLGEPGLATPRIKNLIPGEGFNIIPRGKAPEPFVGNRNMGEAFARSKSKNEFGEKYPEFFTQLAATESGQKILNQKPETTRQADELTVQSMSKMKPEALAGIAQTHQDANTRDIARMLLDAGNVERMKQAKANIEAGIKPDQRQRTDILIGKTAELSLQKKLQMFTTERERAAGRLDAAQKELDRLLDVFDEMPEPEFPKTWLQLDATDKAQFLESEAYKQTTHGKMKAQIERMEAKVKQLTTDLETWDDKKVMVSKYIAGEPEPSVEQPSAAKDPLGIR